MSKRVVEWELGGRNDGTLKKLLDKISLNNKIFYTDGFESYQRCIPKDQHRIGKDLTYPIEQDNSNTRHYLARLRRRSKVTSRSLQMLDLSLLLLYHFSDKAFSSNFLKKFNAIFS